MPASRPATDLRTGHVILSVQVPKGTPLPAVLDTVDRTQVRNIMYPTVYLSQPKECEIYAPVVQDHTVTYAVEATAHWTDPEGLDPFHVLECAHAETSEPWAWLEVVTVLDVSGSPEDGAERWPVYSVAGLADYRDRWRYAIKTHLLQENRKKTI